MEKESISKKVVKYMKVFLKMTNHTVKENLLFKMDQFTRASIDKAKCTDMVYTAGSTVPFIRAFGRIITSMGTESTGGMTVESISVSGKITLFMVKARLSTRTAEFTKENSRMI